MFSHLINLPWRWPCVSAVTFLQPTISVVVNETLLRFVSIIYPKEYFYEACKFKQWSPCVSIKHGTRMKPRARVCSEDLKIT